MWCIAPECSAKMFTAQMESVQVFSMLALDVACVSRNNIYTTCSQAP